MDAFRQNAISFRLLYSGFVSRNSQVLYIPKSAVYLSGCRVVCLLFARVEKREPQQIFS